MYLYYRHTSPRPAFMSRLDDLELALQENLKIQEASFRIGHTDVNEDNEDTRAWVKLLNKDGWEDGNDGMHPKMEQTETPTVT